MKLQGLVAGRGGDGRRREMVTREEERVGEIRLFEMSFCYLAVSTHYSPGMNPNIPGFRAYTAAS